MKTLNYVVLHEELSDDSLGWNAVNMCLLQIGETLKYKLSKNFVTAYGSKLPIQEAYYTKNYISHDYENIDKDIISDIIRRHLPKLKSDIESIIQVIQGEKLG